MKFQIPLFPYFPMFVLLIFGLMGYSMVAAHALTPKERELVQGLNKINQELRADNETKDKAVAEADTKALFLQQKNEALAAKLDKAKSDEAQQTQDLLLAQGKVKALEQDRDRQARRADAAELQAKKKTLEAHRNAVERDICLFAFALVGTVLIMTYSGYIIGWICKLWPAATPFGIGIEIALAVASFTAIYGLGRGTLALIYSHL